jgi:rhomboid protease GluP
MGLDDYDDEEFFDDYDDHSAPNHARGPLSHLPSRDNLGPVFLLYGVFIAASLLYWRTEWGDYLWISGHTFFNEHQYWRALTSVAVHADAVHLLSNGPLFVFFGWLLNAYFGAGVFPLAAVCSGVLATIITVGVYDPQIRLVGASGMVYAMAALWLVLYIRYDYDRPPGLRVLRAVGFALAMLAPTTYNPTTSYLAHGVGFFLGLAAAFILLPFSGLRKASHDAEPSERPHIE